MGKQFRPANQRVTKKDIGKRLSNTANDLGMMANILMELKKKNDTLLNEIQRLGYRMAAVTRIAKISDADIQVEAEKIRLEDFEKEAAQEDATLGLVPSPATEVVTNDFVTFKMDTTLVGRRIPGGDVKPLPESGSLFQPLSVFRGRTLVDTQDRIAADIKNALLGAKLSEPKEFVWEVGMQDGHPEYVGYVVNCKLIVMDIKRLPAPLAETIPEAPVVPAIPGSAIPESIPVETPVTPAL